MTADAIVRLRPEWAKGAHVTREAYARMYRRHTQAPSQQVA